MALGESSKLIAPCSPFSGTADFVPPILTLLRLLAGPGPGFGHLPFSEPSWLLCLIWDVIGVSEGGWLGVQHGAPAAATGLLTSAFLLCSLFPSQ